MLYAEGLGTNEKCECQRVGDGRWSCECADPPPPPAPRAVPFWQRVRRGDFAEYERPTVRGPRGAAMGYVAVGTDWFASGLSPFTSAAADLLNRPITGMQVLTAPAVPVVVAAQGAEAARQAAIQAGQQQLDAQVRDSYQAQAGQKVPTVQRPGTAAGAGSYTPGVYSPELQGRQQAANSALEAKGFCPINADGKIGPATCGAFQAVGMPIPGGCVTFTAPKKGPCGGGGGIVAPAAPPPVSMSLPPVKKAGLFGLTTTQLVLFGAVGALGLIIAKKKGYIGKKKAP